MERTETHVVFLVAIALQNYLNYTPYFVPNFFPDMHRKKLDDVCVGGLGWQVRAVAHSMKMQPLRTRQ
jgi:hypothetical protein